jgi:aspartyl/asparaginyl beta-hydroxylase (cupin superfamily)
MEHKPAITLEQVEILLGILQESRQRHGAEAVARLEDALFGGQTSEPPEDSGGQGFRFPGLTRKPWQDPADYAACRILEDGAEAIQRELCTVLERREGFQSFRQNRDYFVPEQWKTMYFLIGSKPVQDNHDLCPQTARIIRSIPTTFGMAMFSALLPGGHIRPHRGPSNCRITIHLGLVVPSDCALRVGSEARSWISGKCLAFDDTFEHEAWNRSSTTRFVLFLDVWHPDLTEVEIGVLGRVQHLLDQGDHPQSISRILVEREHERGHRWWK